MPTSDPAWLVDLWPLTERTARTCWRLADPTVRDSLRGARVPGVFADWVETGLDEISVAAIAARDPYRDRRGVGRELAKQQADGWLTPLPDGRYAAPPRVREAVAAAVRAGDAAVQTQILATDEITTGDLDRLAELLGAAAALVRTAPGPRWAVDHRMRIAAATDPAVGRIREAAADLYARRDDVHQAAWRRHEDDGRRWNAFALVAGGVARFPAEIAAAARFRGWPAEGYAPDLETLTERGWLAETPAGSGHWQATAAGAAVRATVEAETDDRFRAPLRALDAARGAEGVALLDRFVAAARELRAVDPPAAPQAPAG